MKKVLAVLALLALAAGAGVVVFVTRTPERRACAHAAELCGLSDDQVSRCVDSMHSLAKSRPESSAKVTACVADAKSCAEAMGCAASGALGLGVGLVKDFFTGLQNPSK